MKRKLIQISAPPHVAKQHSRLVALLGEEGIKPWVWLERAERAAIAEREAEERQHE